MLAVLEGGLAMGCPREKFYQGFELIMMVAGTTGPGDFPPVTILIGELGIEGRV